MSIKDLEGSVMAKFEGCKAIGNRGGGFHVQNDSKLIDCVAAYNGGTGFEVAGESLLRRLGLPEDTDPKLLLDWLVAIKNQPVSSREEIVKSATFWDKAGILAPPLSIVSSLLNIANDPLILPTIIAAFSGYFTK